MFQSMKSSKCEDRQINKILAQTIGKYSPLPSQTVNIRKPLPTIYSKIKKDAVEQETKNEGIVGKYVNMKQNLKEYRNIVKEYLNEEQNKNSTFYEQLKTTVEKSKFKTQNWIRNRIKEVQKIFDETLLNIEHKIYSIRENSSSTHEQEDEEELLKIKELKLPLFSFKSIDVKVFQNLIHSYTMISEEASKIQNVKAKFVRNKENIQQNQCQRKEEIQKEEKHIYESTGDDLLCEEDLDWECLTDQNRLGSLMPSNIILEQSESQESSLISTTDFA